MKIKVSPEVLAGLPTWRPPGEEDAIATVKKLGHQFGFGNLIYHLREEWVKMLVGEWGFTRDAAREGAGYPKK